MKSYQIKINETISIGLIGILSLGIFSLLGWSAFLEKEESLLLYITVRLIALVTSYSYIKLSLSYYTNGEIIKIKNQCVKNSLFRTNINNSPWIIYIILLSLYTWSFSTYAPKLINLNNDHVTESQIYIITIILIATIINYINVRVVGKIRCYITTIKMVILLSFVFIGVYGITQCNNINDLKLTYWTSLLKLITSGMIIFIAYEGIELIGNRIPGLESSKTNNSRTSIFLFILIILIYFFTAVFLVGAVEFNQSNTVLEFIFSNEAKLIIGKLGFTLIAIFTLISIISVINVTSYNNKYSENNRTPHNHIGCYFTSKLWNHPFGLFITFALSLIITSTLSLEKIPTMGSISFLVTFAAVNSAGLKLSNEFNLNKIIPFLGLILCIGVLGIVILR